MSREKSSPFASSNVESFSYDDDRRELTVTFHGGRRYVYPEVDKHDHDMLKRAPSKGGHVWGFLRGRSFRHG